MQLRNKSLTCQHAKHTEISIWTKRVWYIAIANVTEKSSCSIYQGI